MAGAAASAELSHADLNDFCFGMINPEARLIAPQILTRIGASGLSVVATRFIPLSGEQVDRLYPNYVNEPWYPIKRASLVPGDGEHPHVISPRRRISMPLIIGGVTGEGEPSVAERVEALKGKTRSKVDGKQQRPLPEYADTIRGEHSPLNHLPEDVYAQWLAGTCDPHTERDIDLRVNTFDLFHSTDNHADSVRSIESVFSPAELRVIEAAAPGLAAFRQRTA